MQGMSCIPWLQVSTLEGTVKLEACTPKGLSDLTNGTTSREFTACPFFNPFFSGITTEVGVEKGYYDLLKQYIGLFVSPSSVVYPLKKDLKRAKSLFQRSRQCRCPNRASALSSPHSPALSCCSQAPPRDERFLVSGGCNNLFDKWAQRELISLNLVGQSFWISLFRTVQNPILELMY